jgi:hypothetical protein
MPAGGEGEGTWLLPDVLVNVLRGGDDGPGVVREVLGVCIGNCMSGLLNSVVFCSSLVMLTCILTYRMDLAELHLGHRAVATW